MDAKYKQDCRDGVASVGWRAAMIAAKEKFDEALLASLGALYGNAVHEKLERQHVIACATIDRAWDMMINPEKYDLFAEDSA